MIGASLLVLVLALDGTLGLFDLSVGTEEEFHIAGGSTDTITALRTVQGGGKVVDPQLALAAWTELDPLSERERQVLRLAGEGLTSGDIASRLGLSHGTVRNYLSECISKLAVSNRVEAYRLARQKGWL